MFFTAAGSPGGHPRYLYVPRGVFRGGKKWSLVCSALSAAMRQVSVRPSVRATCQSVLTFEKASTSHSSLGLVSDFIVNPRVYVTYNAGSRNLSFDFFDISVFTLMLSCVAYRTRRYKFLLKCFINPTPWQPLSRRHGMSLR